jgi:hypothetical protein
VDAEKYGSVLDSFLALLDNQRKVLTSNDDAKWPGRTLNRDPQITFTFKEKGEYWVKLSSLYRKGGPDHIYRLTVRRAESDFLISLKTDRPGVIQGEKGKIAVSLQRLNDFTGDVTVNINGLPRGLTADPLVLRGDKDSGNIEVKASPDVHVGEFSEIEVIGIASVNGNEVERRAILSPGRL